MDLRRLRPGEMVATAGGAVLLAVMFLTWFRLAATGIDTSLTAWQAFDVLDVYLAVVALTAIALGVSSVALRSAAIPVAISLVLLILAGIGLIVLAVRMIDQPGPNAAIEVRPGAWLGLLAVAAIAVGAWLSLRLEGRGRSDGASEVAVRPPPSPDPPPGWAPPQRPAGPQPD